MKYSNTILIGYTVRIANLSVGGSYLAEDHLIFMRIFRKIKLKFLKVS